MTYLICGIDEVGRGSLAGPMFAVAAMFDAPQEDSSWLREHSPIKGIHDSKTFSSHEKRKEIYHRILRHPALVDFGIGEVSVAEIDKGGIEAANKAAFYLACADLKTRPNYLLVDGTSSVSSWPHAQQRQMPKADSYWWPVGAASILAKVVRDTYMAELGRDYPQYELAKNAGYGTKAHIEAIKRFGPCQLHRAQFIRHFV